MSGVFQSGQLTGAVNGEKSLSGSVSADGTLSATVSKPRSIGGTYFTTDETLTLKDGVLSVNTAKEPEPDNTLPITSAAVHATVGNIGAILDTI